MPMDEDCGVFLSFRSEVRKNFTCHLFDALKRKGFGPFMDSENIQLGDEIYERIKKAIKHSKSAIIILSNEFASSKACLNELLLILERNRTSKYFIIPIFYYVETDDVKHQLGDFGAAFERIQNQHNQDIVEQWRAALANIGGILGKEIKEKDGLMETTIIEDILTTFQQKFYDHYPQSLQQQNQVSPPTTGHVINVPEDANRVEETEFDKCKGFVGECLGCVMLCVFCFAFITFCVTAIRASKN